MAVVMVIRTIDYGNVPAMHKLVERCCRVLQANPSWRFVRIALRAGPDGAQVRDAIKTAYAHHLVCHLEGAEIVLEVPDRTAQALAHAVNDHVMTVSSAGGEDAR